MTELIPSHLTDRHLKQAHQVNLVFESVLSPLTVSEMKSLVAQSSYALQLYDGLAFIIAFNHDASYESENLKWFQQRYKSFIYIDRIAIAASHHRRNIGQALYNKMSALAKTQGIDYLCAEVNTIPPNPSSHAFHKSMGFVPVGTADFDGKQVQYYIKEI